MTAVAQLHTPSAGVHSQTDRACIANLQLRDEKVKFRTLGLSATPGSNKDAIQVRAVLVHRAPVLLCIVSSRSPAGVPLLLWSIAALHAECRH
jgi:hypothetical protein